MVSVNGFIVRLLDGVISVYLTVLMPTSRSSPHPSGNIEFNSLSRRVLERFLMK